MRQVLRDLASTNHLADYCADLLTSESSMSDIATWTGCSQDGNGVIDTATLLAMDEFEITSPDLILE